MRHVLLVPTLALAAASAWGQVSPAQGKPAPMPQAPAPAEARPAETDAANAARVSATEQRVSELKERVFRSKARLNLLRETVLHGVIAGSRAIVVHRNEMGGSFRLVKAVYSIDGKQVYAQSDNTGALDDKKEFEVYSGSVVPGDHTVSVVLEYRGHGYGLFPYLQGYTFSVRSSHKFTAAEGKQTVLKVVGYEKGNITTDLKDRPAVDFRINVMKPRLSRAKGDR